VPGRAGVVTWDVATGEEVVRLDDPGLVGVGSAALSGDGRVFAVLSSKDGKVHVWDVATGKERLAFTPGTATGAVALDPAGKTLACWGYEKEPIRLYSTATGKETVRIALDPSARRDWSAGRAALAFAPDGKTLALAAGGALRLWETASGRELCRRETNQGGITALAFSPDGRLLATGGRDTTILVWQATALKTDDSR
jgi:WD40 repeat protein